MFESHHKSSGIPVCKLNTRFDYKRDFELVISSHVLSFLFLFSLSFSHSPPHRWLVGINPAGEIAFGDLPGIFTGGLSTILNNLLAPLITFLDSIIPGIGALIPALAIPTVGLSTIGIEIPIAWSGTLTHTESQEIVVSYSVTAPPQAHVLGRAIAHIGKSSVPFTLDVSRRVHVPAGIFGQTTGQLIAFDCMY